MQTFQFNRERDLGEKIEFTFSFWSKNFKTVLITVLTLVSPFFIISGGLNTYATSEAIRNFSNFTNPSAVLDYQMSLYGSPLFMASMLVSILGYSILSAVGTSLVKVYLDQTVEFTPANVRAKVFSVFGKLVLASIVVGFIVIVATFFFVIPGIYLGVGLSLVAPILVMEEISLSDAMSRSRELIKDNWWSSLGFLIVLGLVAGMLSYLLAFVGGIITGGDFLSVVSSGGDISDTYVNLMLIITAVTSLINPVFTVITQIGSVVLYFSLREKKDATSLWEEAESMA
ncbi:hypothetical protein [Flammeovirga sp. SJP92]|uniref:hypothetical protein n=1 Tax=Flammeovirga sp. SJP92 TaxID=1775430 RepID=UPI0007877E0B|nr:hypothetical protein [Flammeovirga sp. SJP92]KXX68730.1 hypothetical protein AVL50_18840 [Flammeovirga sp. SJP92]